MTFSRIAAWMTGGLLLAALGGIGILTTVDLRPRLERSLSGILGRQVGIGLLQVEWHGGPTLRLDEVHVANAAWADEPEMLHIVRLDADIDGWPLLRGVLQYRSLRIDGLDLLLERTTDGTPNWRVGRGDGGSIGHFAVLPRDRAQVSTLLDLRIQNSRMRYRTTSGAMLRFGLSSATVSTNDVNAPVAMTLSGSYGDATGSMTIQGASFTALRDVSNPYHVDVSAVAAASTLDFHGTLIQPLDVDGIDGELQIKLRAVGGALAAIGIDIPARFALTAGGALRRSGDHWRLDSASGQVGPSAFTGDLALTEGARGQPDEFEAKLRFDRLQLDPLLAGTNSHPVSLRLDPSADRIKAQLVATQVDYHGLEFTQAELRFDLRAEQASLNDLSFGIDGGRINITASLRNAGPAGHISTALAVTGLDLALVSTRAGAKRNDIAGRVDGRAAFEMTGATLSTALRTSEGHAVLAMTNGRIARTLLELASTDLRTLLRRGEGSVQVACSLAAFNVRNGVALLSPLRLRTAQVTLEGGGTFDLARQFVDVEIHADRSGFFALDLPIRIVGPIQKPAIGLAGPAGPATMRRAAGATAGWPPEIAHLAAANPCSQ